MPFSIQVPNRLQCPLTQTIMVDPVFYKGHTYERKTLEEKIKQENTNLTQELNCIFSDERLKKEIKDFVSNNQKTFESELFKAIEQDDQTTVELILNLGINPNIKDQKGWTPLHHGAYQGQQKNVEFWLLKEVDKDIATASLSGLYSPPELAQIIEHLKREIELLKMQLEKINKEGVKVSDSENISEIAIRNQIDELNKRDKNLREQITIANDFSLYCKKNSGLFWYERDTYDKRMSDWRKLAEYLPKQEEEKRINCHEMSKLNSLYNNFCTPRDSIQAHLLKLESELQHRENELQQRKNKLFHGLTPLHLGVFHGDLKSVALLLDKGTKIDTSDANGATPMFWAIYRNNLKLLKFLNERGANQQTIDSNGNTLLHAGAQYADKAIVMYLLELGFYYQVKNRAGQTPADIALEYRREEVAKYINEVGEKQWQSTPRRLYELNNSIKKSSDTSKKQIKELTKRLQKIEQTKSENISLSEPNKELVTEISSLKQLVELQQKQLVEQQQLILEQTKKIEVIQNLPQSDVTLDNLIWSAVKNGYIKQLNTLLKIGADVAICDNQGLTPLHWAVLKGHRMIATALLENASQQLLNAQDQEGHTALHLAALSGNISLAILLLHRKAALEILNHQGKSAYEFAGSKEIQQAIVNQMLYNAAKIGSIEEAQKALNLGADINAVDTCNDINETALHKASYYKHANLVDFLIKNGANAQAKDKYGNTPAQVIAHIPTQKAIRYANFLKAVVDGNISSINNMAAEGLDVKAVKDEAGSTALHIAISQFKSLEVIKTLMRLGSDLNSVNQQGQTPLHIAAQLGNHEAAAYLLNNGANVMVKDIEGITSPKLAIKKGYLDLASFIYEFALNKPSAPQSSGYHDTFFPAVSNAQLNQNSGVSIRPDDNEEQKPTSSMQYN